mmetsp:Transcript_83579/g.233300  ORF Transcript_83579/g.233300 Transcript_83579/m.233300 type:complete len:229 (+) Transcript_83579:727-1413(+)
MPDAKDVFVGLEAHAGHHFAWILLRHVRPAGARRRKGVLPDLEVRAEADRDETSHRDVHVGRCVPAGLKVVQRLVLPKVPNLPIHVRARGDHIVVVHRDAGHVAVTREYLGNGLLCLRRPERNDAVRVAQMNDGVARVVPHAPRRPQPGPVRGNLLASGNVAVVQVRSLARRHQQEVVRQEIQMRGECLVFQTMQLHPRLVVHIHVLLLRNSEHQVAVQRLDGADRLF